MFEVFEQAMNLHIYKKCHWHRATSELAACTARVEDARQGQERYYKHCVITHAGKNNIGGF